MNIDIAPFRVGTIIQAEGKTYMIENFTLGEGCVVEHGLKGSVPTRIEATVVLSCVPKEGEPLWQISLYGEAHRSYAEIFHQWYRVRWYDVKTASLTLELQRAFWMDNEHCR